MTSAWPICLSLCLNSQLPCLSPRLPPGPVSCTERSLVGCVPIASVSNQIPLGVKAHCLFLVFPGPWGWEVAVNIMNAHVLL